MEINFNSKTALVTGAGQGTTFTVYNILELKPLTS
jgi:hypothetical protein